MTTPAVATAPAVPRTGGRTSQGSMAVARTGGRTQQGTGAGRQVRPGPRPRPSRQPRPAAGTGGRKRSGPGARLTRRTPSGTGTAYQNVILAEFVAAVILVAVTPFTSKNKTGLSPYAPTDMFRLVAITVTYLILALISGANQSAARVAAWVGGLILVASTLDRGAQIAKDLQLFGGAAGAAAAQGPGHGQAPGPPGQAGGPVPPGGQR